MRIIELGGGEHPEPGTINVDCLNIPQTNMVVNFCEDPLPFESDSVDAVVMNHSIEHIPLLKLNHVMTELYRVMKQGAEIRIRTPNLTHIVKEYLAGKMSLEQPKDIANWHRTMGQYNPAVWANLRLFSGQDYPSNTHYTCYDWYMLNNMLRRYGFEKMEDMEGRDYQTGELRVRAFKCHS